MARRRKKGRDITGIVVVDKPTGRSSNHVLQQVKRLFDANKAGHTGNLDPLATGVLPICLGEATKLASYLLDGDKRYHVTGQLGSLTDSGDSDGSLLEMQAVPEFSEQQLGDILTQFTGQQAQRPPMYSALKHQGQPLYKFARQGIEVERKERVITIHNIELLDYTDDTITLDVTCSKGTYIRTLIESISQALGTVGHVTMLRRVSSSGYNIADAIALEQLEQHAEQGSAVIDNVLVPEHEILADWPSLQVNDEQIAALRHGQTIEVSDAYSGALVRLLDQQHLLGIAEMSENGTVSPKRVFVAQQSD